MLLVLVAHTAGTKNSPVDVRLLRPYDIGDLGLRIFFVMSGFLITTIIVRERERTGKVDLGMFYLRRSLRIFPPYYVFLAMIAVGGLLRFFPLDVPALLQAATYTSNYTMLRNGSGYLSFPLAHTWSLAAEEQFYLLWPVTLVMLGNRKAFLAAALLLFLAPIFRIVEYMNPITRPGVGLTFESVGDGLAAGCLMAALRDVLPVRFPTYAWLMRFRLTPLIGLAMTQAHLVRNQVAGGAWVSRSIEILGIVLLVDWCIRNSEGRIGRVLNWPPIVLCGTMGYSFYLWQQPFLTAKGASGWANTFPLNVLLTAIATMASFYLIEKPTLALRPRLEAALWRLRARRARRAGRAGVSSA